MTNFSGELSSDIRVALINIQKYWTSKVGKFFNSGILSNLILNCFRSSVSESLESQVSSLQLRLYVTQMGIVHAPLVCLGICHLSNKWSLYLPFSYFSPPVSSASNIMLPNSRMWRLTSLPSTLHFLFPAPLTSLLVLMDQNAFPSLSSAMGSELNQMKSFAMTDLTIFPPSVTIAVLTTCFSARLMVSMFVWPWINLLSRISLLPIFTANNVLPVHCSSFEHLVVYQGDCLSS